MGRGRMTRRGKQWPWWTAGLVLAALLLVFLMNAAPNSAFAIAATTDVIVVEPSCGDKLTWDLPPGWVLADNAPLEGSASADAVSMKPATPVTVELAAGARATVSREAAGVWKMRFEQGSAYRRCTPAPPSALVVTVDGERLPPDPSGYSYQSTYGEGLAGDSVPAEGTARPLIGPAPPLVLRLAGRIVLGQVMSEGGGWSAASQPMLRGARVEVRYAAPITNQSLSVLLEDIGPGAIIDTHKCLARESTGGGMHCVFKQVRPATGFLYYPTSDGEVSVQVYRSTDRIGVVPFGGVQRKLGVTRWAGWVKTPWVQFIVAALLLGSALLQGWLSLLELLRKT